MAAALLWHAGVLPRTNACRFTRSASHPCDFAHETVDPRGLRRSCWTLDARSGSPCASIASSSSTRGAAHRAISSRHPRASVIAAIRLLMLPGCRKSEILSLRWEHVDLDAGELRLPDSKTGAKVVHLGDPAISVLLGIRRDDGNPWVIAGPKTGKPMTDLDYYWQRIRDRAGLEGLWIHDLRHSCASFDYRLAA